MLWVFSPCFNSHRRANVTTSVGLLNPGSPFGALSSQQLPGYRVGWMGCLQCHLWSWHEKERAHGEDAPSRWLHLWSRSARSGEVHDARMPWVAAYSWPQLSWHFRHVRPIKQTDLYSNWGSSIDDTIVGIFNNITLINNSDRITFGPFTTYKLLLFLCFFKHIPDPCCT